LLDTALRGVPKTSLAVLNSLGFTGLIAFKKGFVNTIKYLF